MIEPVPDLDTADSASEQWASPDGDGSPVSVTSGAGESHGDTDFRTPEPAGTEARLTGEAIEAASASDMDAVQVPSDDGNGRVEADVIGRGMRKRKATNRYGEWVYH